SPGRAPPARRKEPGMKEPSENKEIEERITMEIIVDAYGPEEQALGWYYYLENNLHVPFRARCIAKRTISPLQIGEEVEVVGMPPEEECEDNRSVLINGQGRSFGVPLAQLEGIDVDAEPRQAIQDRHYWVAREYQF